MCIRESHVYSYADKKGKRKKKVLAMPNRTNLFRRFHQPDTKDSITNQTDLVKRKKERKRERKKRTEKRKSTKRERIDLLPFRLSGSLAIHPFFFCLSLSLSPIRLSSTKRKRQKKTPRRLRSWLKIQPKRHRYIKPPHHKSLRLGVYTSSGSTLRPTDRAAFPPPPLSRLSSCHWSSHCIHAVGWCLE